MDTATASAASGRLIVTKGSYAAHRGVHASRVSQYISEGKLTPPALVGEGRTARIDVAEADRQLGRHLDPGQVAGASLQRNLPAAPAATDEFDLPSAPEGDAYRDTKTAIAQIQLRKAEIELAEMQGRLRPVDEIADALGACGQSIARRCDRIASWADQLAALPPGDVSAMRGELRRLAHDFRQGMAEELARVAGNGAATDGEEADHDDDA